MSTEVEAKFIVPDREASNAIQAADALAGYRLQPGRLIKVNDAYLDTPGHAFLAAGYACRRREQEGGIIMTLKATAPSLGVIHRREELEARLLHDCPPALWPPGEARDTALAVVHDEPLRVLFHLHQQRFVRAAFDGQRRVAEVSLDTVDVAHGKSVERYIELELELAAEGTEDDLAAMAAWVQGHHHVLLSTKSKFERAMEMSGTAGGTPPLPRQSRRAKAVALPEETIALEAPEGMSADALLQCLTAMGYRPKPRAKRSTTEVFFDSHEGALLRKGRTLCHSHEARVWRLRKGEQIEAEQTGQGDAPPDEGEIPDALSRLTRSRVSIPFLQASVEETEYWLQGFASRALRLFIQSWSFIPPFQEVAPRTSLSLIAKGQPHATGLPYFGTLLRERLSCRVPAGTHLEQGLARLGLPVPGAPIPARFLLLRQETQRSACRKILGGEAWRMRTSSAGVLHDLDIEYVHVMRVATRRARFAVRLFASFLSEDAGPALRAELAWIAGLLGAVRDLDVLLASLSRHLSLLVAPADFEEKLRRRLTEARSSALAALATALGSDRYARLLQGLESPGFCQNEIEDDIPVRRFAAGRMDKTMAKLGRWTGRPTESLSDTDMHALRILFKRLRYTCEFFRPLFGREIGGLISSCTAYQDCLGLLQDAAVAIAMLQTFAVKISDAGASPGFLMSLGALIQVQRDIQRSQKVEFLRLWGSATEIAAQWKGIRDLGEAGQ